MKARKNRQLSWQEKKKDVLFLIIVIHTYYGGNENDAWLKEYAHDVVMAHKEDLDKVIDCFYDIAEGSGALKHYDAVNRFKPDMCDCGHVKPFCPH